MRRQRTRCLSAVMLVLSAVALAGQGKQEDRLRECGTVLKEILGMPDSLPKDLLDRAECVIVVPSVKKVAVGVGGSYGRGAMTCRTGANFDGPWSAPAMMALEGGSIGFQLGGQATDFVLLVMNPRGADSVLKSKVKLGADASAAAGPKGRTAGAATDATMRAEILTYSRARGLFAGVSLEGSTLRADHDADTLVYGKEIDTKSIITGTVTAPAAANVLIDALNKQSPANRSGS
jgi:SH3 domain-containing YSC84-like protein 1